MDFQTCPQTDQQSEMTKDRGTKLSFKGTNVSVVLMDFNGRFVPDRGTICFSTLVEPLAEDRCNSLIIVIVLVSCLGD